jgi:hypothetical protein
MIPYISTCTVLYGGVEIKIHIFLSRPQMEIKDVSLRLRYSQE